jgi:hypothetical protein
MQFTVMSGYWPYLLLALAGAADLVTTVIGTNTLGLVEGNPNFTPFLTQTVLILYIFVVRKITFFPERTKRLCEAGLVIYSFSPAIWNFSLILIRLLA